MKQHRYYFSPLYLNSGAGHSNTSVVHLRDKRSAKKGLFFLD